MPDKRKRGQNGKLKLYEIRWKVDNLIVGVIYSSKPNPQDILWDFAKHYSVPQQIDLFVEHHLITESQVSAHYYTNKGVILRRLEDAKYYA